MSDLKIKSRSTARTGSTAPVDTSPDHPAGSGTGATSAVTGGGAGATVARRSLLGAVIGRFTAGRQLIAGEVVVVVAFGSYWNEPIGWLLLGWLLTVLSYASSGLYRPRLHLALLDQVPPLLSSAVTSMTVAATIPALWGVDLELRRHAAGAALLFTGQLCMRGAIFAGIRFARAAGAVAHPTVLLGNSDSAQKVAGILDRHRSYGLRVVGYVADRPTVGSADGGWNYLGGLDQLPKVVREHQVEILILDETASNRPGLLDGLRRRGGSPSAFVMPHNWKIATPRAADDHIGAVPIMRLNGGTSPAQLVGKRLFDLVLAAVSVVVLSPLMALVALLIVCEDGQGPLFRQVRVGRNGRLFEMYKFRSMCRVSAETSDTAGSAESALRIGRIGKFIRKTSIDELPQLFNILRGDMTFVGPRPERPHYVEQFSAMFPDYGSRHRVTVGLTGLAQVSGLRGDTSIDDRVRHDNYYIDHWNLWFDIKVLVWTLGQTFGARGS